MNVGSLKSIWAYGGRFDGKEGSSLFSWGGGGGVGQFYAGVL